jgi:cytochrome P450
VVNDFRHASVIEGVRFTAQVGLPNVVQGLFKKRELPTKVAAIAKAEAQGHALVAGLVERLGTDPFYVRVATDEALLLTDPADIEHVLGGSPDPFASDPEAKRKGMAAFQPDALTISRGDLWRTRRAFAEHVLATGAPLHPLGPVFLDVVSDAVAGLVALEEVGWEDVNDAFARVTRRVVLGDAAGGDHELTRQLGELMAAGNKQPGKPAAGYDDFIARLRTYTEAGDPKSLAGLVADAPGDVDAAGQVIHWLFAMGDTLALNLFRTLALLATHPEQLHEARAEVGQVDTRDAGYVAGLDYVAGCLLDTMRLWPTTALFGRVTTRDVEMPGGQVVKEGTQVLIYNVFNHRNRDRVPYADRFAPGEWSGGDAGESWLFNFFSHGPQGCPGAGLSVFLGQAFLANVVERWTPQLIGATLDDSQPLPHGLDAFGFRIRFQPR